MNPWYIDPLHITLRLLLALVLGGFIGCERELSSHAAGFRTHILVCVGSALIMLLSIYGFSEFVNETNVRVDPSRLAAQVISGIGFLGAGTILRNGHSITGLTTAASLWVVAAIGLAVGAGFFFASILSCFMVLISLWILNKVEKKYFAGKRVRLIKIHALDQPGSLGVLSSILGKIGIDIRKVALEEEEEQRGEKKVMISFAVKISKPALIASTLEEIRQLPCVIQVAFE